MIFYTKKDYYTTLTLSNMPSPLKKTTLAKIVGRKIMSIREEHDLSQQRLAELLGYKSRTVICSIESGRRPPTINNLEQLAYIFGKHPSWFFENDGEKSMIHYKAEKYDYWLKQIERVFLGNLEPEFKRLFKVLPSLEPEKREMVLQLVREVV